LHAHNNTNKYVIRSKINELLQILDNKGRIDDLLSTINDPFFMHTSMKKVTTTSRKVCKETLYLKYNTSMS